MLTMRHMEGKIRPLTCLRSECLDQSQLDSCPTQVRRLSEAVHLIQERVGGGAAQGIDTGVENV